MEIINKILTEINDVMKKIDENQLNNVAKTLQPSKRIYIVGAGRNALQAKGFGMRLMHIGYQVFIVGETNTPAMKEDDILIAVSGSGSTKSVLMIAEKAKKLGGKLIAVTSNSNSLLSELADVVLVVPGATRDSSEVTSIQLLSSLFDQTLHLTFDTLCLMIAQRDKTDNSYAKTMHSNLE